jgi:hypothetical protein
MILTDRQREVLARICEGKTDKEIGRELFISEETVNGRVAQKDLFPKSGRLLCAIQGGVSYIPAYWILLCPVPCWNDLGMR